MRTFGGTNRGLRVGGRCVVACALILAACTGAPPVAPSSGISTASALSPVPAPRGACANEWFPVSEGNSWTYDDHVYGLSDTTNTQKIAATTSRGFTLTNGYETIATPFRWSCTPRGLIALDFGSGPTAALSAGGSSAKVKTLKVTGITFPAHISVGDTWRQIYAFSYSARSSSGSERASGKAASVYKAIGMRRVRAAPGNFETIEIEETIRLTMTVRYQGKVLPVHADFSISLFFAKGVGMVMQVIKGTVNGRHITGSQSLSNYSIAPSA